MVSCQNGAAIGQGGQGLESGRLRDRHHQQTGQMNQPRIAGLRSKGILRQTSKGR